MGTYAETIPEIRAAAKRVADGVSEMLVNIAGLMEAGELPMVNGPAALRMVAVMVNQTLIQLDDEAEAHDERNARPR